MGIYRVYESVISRANGRGSKAMTEAMMHEKMTEKVKLVLGLVYSHPWLGPKPGGQKSGEFRNASRHPGAPPLTLGTVVV